jgi:putative glycosyltransferase (TIGR04372 family)
MSQVARQWSQIRAGGWSVLRRKLRLGALLAADWAFLALSALWAVPAILIIRLLRPWRRIRVGMIESARVGHFVADSTLLFVSHSLQPADARSLDLIWLPQPTSNKQWEQMVARTFVVGWWVRPLMIFNRLIPGSSAHEIPPSYRSRDLEGSLQRSAARLKFTASENARAKRWLMRRGWKEGEPFVCLLVRDAAYLGSHPGHRATSSSPNWSYHSYRDSDIEIFRDAAMALVDQGYWVIRMGKLMAKPFSLAHPRVIDYPFAGDQDDLLDIWLSAHCAFFISTSAGLDQVAIAYGRPLSIVNSLPYSDSQTFVPSVCAPKRLRWKSSGRLLTMMEMLEHSHHHTEDYEREGIVIEDLTPAEITAAVLECEARTAGTRTDRESEEHLQKRFWDAFKAWPGFHDFHGYIHPDAKVGARWLESMGPDFLPGNN